ncbi:glycosyltransferase family 39 protein [Candidatus Berkelbacteria bacterium]|nr:glycosyltransferase family 39 protein [Candidatus Berkelbacteria bacterium]
MVFLVKKISPKLILSCCLLLIFIQFAVQLKLARDDSPTTDEAIHLFAGYTYLIERDYRFNPEHPPLLKTLSAIPLLFITPNLPKDYDTLWQKSDNTFYDSWAENRVLGDKFMYTSQNNPDQLIFWGRIPTVIITALLALTLLLFSKKIFGVWGALLATTLFTTNPTVNGHGHLITTDMILALSYLLTVITAYKFVTKPTALNSIIFGLALGLALLSKHTAIILIPIIIGCLIFLIAYDKTRKKSLKMLPKLLITAVVIWAVIWAGFGFNDDIAPRSTSITQEIINSSPERVNVEKNETLDKIYTNVRPLLVTLPLNYIKGVILVLNHTGGGHSSYLLGKVSNTGWWYYFPLLFFVKSPLPFLIAFTIGLWAIIKKEKKLLIWTLAIFGIGFLGFAMISKANLGIRHILPTMPLFILLSTWGILQIKNYKTPILILSIWALGIYIIGYPTYLGYFNELAGGARNGYKIATDSNLDWGQDLKRIKNYIQKNNIISPVIDYGWLGKDGLDYYLGDYRVLESTKPSTSDTVIISASIYATRYKFQFPSCDNKIISNAVFVCKTND